MMVHGDFFCVSNLPSQILNVSLEKHLERMSFPRKISHQSVKMDPPVFDVIAPPTAVCM